MAGIKLTAFSGIAPKIANRNLPDGMAQISDNCRLLSGSLRAFSDKLPISSNTLRSGTVRSIFRLIDGYSDYWISWNEDVDCVRSQVVGDVHNRIYWTGDNEPRTTSFAKAVNGGGVMPDSCFVLGVVAPLVAPTVTPTGGVGAALVRGYVETFVTQYGEEGAPSPVQLVTGKADTTTWALSALNAAPINTAAISGAVHSVGIVTITTASTKYLRAGEEVVHDSIVGMTDLNGSFVITEIIDTSHYKVALTTAQTYTSGGTWTRIAPHNTDSMTRRIYRTLSGKYYFVAELPIATTTYNDVLTDAELQEELPSLGWALPPATMKGIIALPNGVNAAIDGYDICFSEPWYPHAWPIKYRQPCGFEPVGIASFGTSIVVGTKGIPHIITGSHPDSMSIEKGRSTSPCLSKRSVIGVGDGVIYSSPDGLVFENGSSDMATAALFSRDEWAKLNPSTVQCAFHNGMLFGWHDVNASLHTGFVFNLSSGSFSSISIPATAAFVDAETNNLYVVTNGSLCQWDAHSYNDLTYDWKSKVFSLSRPVNFSYARVDADYNKASQVNEAVAADTAYNVAVLATGITDGEFDAAMLDEYMLDGSLLRGGSTTEYAGKTLRITIIADGVERYTETLLNNKSFSLPSGYKASLWEFRISGNLPCYGVYVADSPAGLKLL